MKEFRCTGECFDVEPGGECDAENGYLCTRARGHDGPHIACGTEGYGDDPHNWTIWWVEVDR